MTCIYFLFESVYQNTTVYTIAIHSGARKQCNLNKSTNMTSATSLELNLTYEVGREKENFRNKHVPISFYSICGKKVN